MKRKIAFVTTVIVLILSLTVSIGCTIAYLFDTSATVTNIFNPQNIDVKLEESDNLDLQMVPGKTITKDPKVTVDTDIPCYVFVEIDEKNNVWNTITVIDWAIAEGWILVPDTTNVYYKTLAKGEQQEIPVLKDNTVKVSTDVTKEYMDAVEKGTITKPTLTFTAYVCQMLKEGTTDFTPAEAWATAKPAN